jgi:hypothetical protein
MREYLDLGERVEERVYADGWRKDTVRSYMIYKMH